MGWRMVLLWDELMDPQTDCRLMRLMAILMMVPEWKLNLETMMERSLVYCLETVRGCRMKTHSEQSMAMMMADCWALQMEQQSEPTMGPN